MAISTGMLNADFDYMADDLPCSLTAISGTTLGTAITGTWGEVSYEQDIVIRDAASSDITERERVAAFSIADFTSVPDEGASVTIDGVIYYIQTREDDPMNVVTTWTIKRT